MSGQASNNSTNLDDQELNGVTPSQFDETDLGQALIARDLGLSLTEEQSELVTVFDVNNTPRTSPLTEEQSELVTVFGENCTPRFP